MITNVVKTLMNKKPEKYLDKILNILAENFGQNFTVTELMNIINSKKNNREKVDMYLPEQLIEIRTALTFLASENLIRYKTENNGEVTLLYEGYLKIRTNSFSKEISDKSINKTLQRLAWIVPIIISFAALLVSIYKNSSNENCIDKKKPNVCKINKNASH